MRLALDTETFNEAPITVGSYKYAETVEILLISYAIDDQPAEVLDLTAGEREAKLAKIQALVDGADEIILHNSSFDRIVLAAEGVTVPVEKIVDTMVLALLHSLPAGLDALCDVLKVPKDKAKDKAGKRLIQLFCRPRPKNMKLRRATRETHPQEWAEFIEYARQDIPSMLAVYERLPKWNYTQSERELWLLDQRINDRGVKADTELATAALRAFQRTSKEMAARATIITEGAVGSLTQRQKLLDYLSSEHDFEPDDMTKGTVAALLKRTDLDPEVRELLVIRQQASAASPAKYRAVINSACRDGRLRGMTQFSGAGRTFRDSGRLVQLQNLPRPTLKPYAVEAGIAAIKADCEDLIYDNVSEVCVNAVRGCLIADDDKKLVVADLSNIEGRIAAWLAGESWKIQAFKDYDAGTGLDLYILAYARSFGIKPEDVTKALRQIGKVMELAFQFGGALGAFHTMGANYGVTLPDEEIITLVKAWRSAHPAIRAMWYDIERAAKSAIREPKGLFVVRDLQFTMQDGYLRIRKPGGGYLSYCNAELSTQCPKCKGACTLAAKGTIVECDKCFGTGEVDSYIRYEGTNQYTRKWEWLSTYSGKLFENIVQSTARDVFMRGLRAAEQAGYPVVVRVHDELVCETSDNDNFTVAELSDMMSSNAGWMLGLPLAAAGHEMRRYAKMD